MLDKEKYNDYTLGIKTSIPNTDNPPFLTTWGDARGVPTVKRNGKIIAINPATNKPFPKVKDIYVELRKYIQVNTMLISHKHNVNLIVNVGEHKDIKPYYLTREPELDTNKQLFVETAILNRWEKKKCLEQKQVNTIKSLLYGLKM